MSRPGPDAPRFCRDAEALPAFVIVAALAMEPAARSEDIMDVPDCMLQADHPGDHYGLVASVTGDHAVWATWGDEPPCLERRMDCNTCPQGSVGSACTLYAGHEGLHSFALYDPFQEAARAILAGLPLTGPAGLDGLPGI